MVTKLSDKKRAQFFVEQSTPSCRKCKNFGSFSCPNFQKAINEDGVEPEYLTAAIEEDQKEKILEPCSNA
ncbi:MAG: hypothetical protein AAF569_03060 [Pseudomonadota bacterium]